MADAAAAANTSKEAARANGRGGDPVWGGITAVCAEA